MASILPDGPSLLAFVLASLALLLAPGPAVMYIVARGIDQGRMAGVVSALGIQIGGLVHVAAAALGLSALLAASVLAFNVVKWLGAAYLIYLGLRKLLEKTPATDDTGILPEIEAQPLKRIFWQGAVVNLLNPKLALFFLAFLPQFADPARGPVGVQIAALGVLFLSMAVVTDSLYGLLAGTVGGWVKRRPAVLRGQKYLTGGTYIALGVAAAVSGRHSG